MLNMTDAATAQLVARATASPAKGFRFPGFAAHYQDYEPSLDHFGFMRTGLDYMLLAPLDDAKVRCVVCAFSCRLRLPAALLLLFVFLLLVPVLLCTLPFSLPPFKCCCPTTAQAGRRAAHPQGSILVFPTFPTATYNVRFKMHGPRGTTIEASCQGGQLEYLIVTPSSRKADVTVMNCPAA